VERRKLIAADGSRVFGVFTAGWHDVRRVLGVGVALAGKRFKGKGAKV
jgi:hypothetical protein